MSHLQLPVEEFTTPNPITAEPRTLLLDLIGLMQTYQIRHLPIVQSGRVVGIVSDRDVRLAAGLTQDERKQVSAADIMTTEPVVVSAGETLQEVAYQMSELKIGSVIVNDENDQMLGIFTVTDALNALIEIAGGAQA